MKIFSILLYIVQCTLTLAYVIPTPPRSSDNKMEHPTQSKSPIVYHYSFYNARQVHGASQAKGDFVSRILSRRQASTQALNQLKQMAPGIGNCAARTSFQSECTEPQDTVNPLLAGLYKYNIVNAPEQAAVISWMTFESDDFHYKSHHFPSVNPGQGTSCMMSPSFVQQYAASIPELSGKIPGKSPADVLSLVTDNRYVFAAASWFYSTQCSTDVKNAVKSGTQVGWSRFVTECVHTTMDDGRVKKWELTMTALGLTPK